MAGLLTKPVTFYTVQPADEKFLTPTVRPDKEVTEDDHLLSSSFDSKNRNKQVVDDGLNGKNFLLISLLHLRNGKIKEEHLIKRKEFSPRLIRLRL